MKNLVFIIDFMIRKFLLFFAGVLVYNHSNAQLQNLPKPDIYPYLVERFQEIPNTEKQIVFLGNSLTFWGDWENLFSSSQIKNYGIPGDHTFGLLDRLDWIISAQPKKIFLLIGINDLARQMDNAQLISNLKSITSSILKVSPHTQIYIQSILPTNPSFDKLKNHYGHESKIKQINLELKAYSNSSSQITFVDLYTHFLDDNGYLNQKYTWDGVHLNVKGYALWRDVLIHEQHITVEDLLQKSKALELNNQAKKDLLHILDTEEKWVKVHAAEFLLWENVHKDEVKQAFLIEDAKYYDIPQYRIGIWRVLAQTAHDEVEKMFWINKIKNVYFDEASTDKLHAIETLAKLKVPVLPHTDLSILMKMPTTSFELYKLWNLAYLEGVDKGAIVNFLLDVMEKSVGKESEKVNFLVSSYILRSFGTLSKSAFLRLESLTKQVRNDVALAASVFGTQWVTLPKEKEFGFRSELRNNLYSVSHHKSAFNQVLLSLAKYSDILDKKHIIDMYEVLKNKRTDDYDADIHASVAYLILAFTNPLLNTTYD